MGELDMDEIEKLLVSDWQSNESKYSHLVLRNEKEIKDIKGKCSRAVFAQSFPSLNINNRDNSFVVDSEIAGMA